MMLIMITGRNLFITDVYKVIVHVPNLFLVEIRFDNDN